LGICRNQWLIARFHPSNEAQTDTPVKTLGIGGARCWLLPGDMRVMTGLRLSTACPRTMEVSKQRVVSD